MLVGLVVGITPPELVKVVDPCFCGLLSLKRGLIPSP